MILGGLMMVHELHMISRGDVMSAMLLACYLIQLWLSNGSKHSSSIVHAIVSTRSAVYPFAISGSKLPHPHHHRLTLPLSLFSPPFLPIPSSLHPQPPVLMIHIHSHILSHPILSYPVHPTHSFIHSYTLLPPLPPSPSPLLLTD